MNGYVEHAAVYGVGALACGALLGLLVRAARTPRAFPLSIAALVEGGADGGPLVVSLSSDAAQKIVRFAAYRTPGVLGCAPRLRLKRRGWQVGAELQLSPGADVAAVSAAFEAQVREALVSQTHMKVATVKVRATFEPVEKHRLR